MKPTDKKIAFVRLRAEGRSYEQIGKELGIAKGTCCKWGRELAAEVDQLKKQQLRELCESYGMAATARITNLGNTLDKINAAIAEADFSYIDPDKLLDLKLKYTEALKGEYGATAPAMKLDGLDADRIMEALGDLLNRVRAGEVTAAQARQEAQVLSQLHKAYDTAVVKSKLDEIETIISSIGGNQ